MNTLQQKLRENKNKIEREKFLSVLDSTFSVFLSKAECSSEVSCIKYAAFPKWDDKANVQTTTRGKVKNWNNFAFKTWQKLISVLTKFQQVKNYIGWFYIDTNGPYYRISLNAFLSHIQSISDYAINNEHYNFGWIGEVDDIGIIIEENHTSSSDNEFKISIWGI
jgi:hypothetical protein